MLNKKVGDYGGWEHRQTYCRVYDPRNFEFEITIENLLYILENANSIKGKGLEGEFVYGWDGKDLVLMPVESPDYKKISEYNKIVHNNESIKAKDLIIGATYLTKDNQERIYMGKFDYFHYGYRWLENGEYKSCKKYNDVPRHHSGGYSWSYSAVPHESIDYPYGKYFWFAYKYYDYEYVNGERVNKSTYRWMFEQVKSITANKFITCADDKCTSDYADIYEAMIHTYNFSPRDYDHMKYIPYTFEEFKEYAEKETLIYGRTRRDNYRFYSDGHYKYEIHCDEKTNLWTAKQVSTSRMKSTNENDFYDRFDFNVTGSDYWTKKEKKEIVPMTIETLYEKLKPCYKEIYLENGYLYKKECYYGDKE